MATELGRGVVVARYRVDRLLGRGGMGQVWAATHTVTQRPFALKLLHGTFPSRAAKRRFLNEAKLGGLVCHPNVVNVLDFFELADGRPVMVMELLQGETLRAKLAREGPLSFPVAAPILLQLVSAVGSAHACGVVHRDLKPENVFLCPAVGGRMDAHVLDFGIAKFMSPSASDSEESGATTGTGSIIGTAHYMSPEQAGGDEVDHRADVWSLGVVMYEVLTGSRPVEGANFPQVLKRLLTEVITPIAVLVPDLPADVAALVDRMLQTHRDDRPPDLREVAEVLGRYVSVLVPAFGAPEPEVPIGPDSSPTSAPHTVIEVAGESDPNAATEVVESARPPPSPTSVSTVSERRSHRPSRAVAIAVAAFSIGVLPWAWSRRPSVEVPRLPVAVAPAPSHAVVLRVPGDVPPESAEPSHAVVLRVPGDVPPESAEPRAPRHAGVIIPHRSAELRGRAPRMARLSHTPLAPAPADPGAKPYLKDPEWNDDLVALGNRNK